MNDIDGGVGMLAIQFLIFLGAVEGHLEFCIVILMAEMMLIILAIPAVILWGIKTISVPLLPWWLEYWELVSICGYGMRIKKQEKKLKK